MPFVQSANTVAQEAGGSRLLLVQQGRTAAYAVPTDAASALVAAVPFNIGTNTDVETDLDRYIKRVYRFSEFGLAATSQAIDNPTIGESVDRSRPQAGGQSAEGNLVLVNVTQGLEPLLQTLTGDRTPTVADVTGPPAALRYTFSPSNTPLPGLGGEVVKGNIPDRFVGAQVNTLEVNLSRNELSPLTFGMVALDYQTNTHAATTPDTGTPFANITDQIDPTDVLTGYTENPAVGFVGWSAGLFLRTGGAADPSFSIATNADLTSNITGFTQIPSGRAGVLTFVKSGTSAGTIAIVGEDINGNALTETLTFTTANPETMTTSDSYGTITSITPDAFTAGTVTITANLPAGTGSDERLGGTSARFNYNNNFSIAEDLIGTRGAQRVTRGSNFRELSMSMTLPYSRENLGLVADFLQNASPLNSGDNLVIQFTQAVGGGLPDAELSFIIADAALESNPSPAVASPGEVPNEISLRLLPEVGANNVVSVTYTVPAASGIQLQQYS